MEEDDSSYVAGLTGTWEGLSLPTSPGDCTLWSKVQLTFIGPQKTIRGKGISQWQDSVIPFKVTGTISAGIEPGCTSFELYKTHVGKKVTNTIFFRGSIDGKSRRLEGTYRHGTVVLIRTGDLEAQLPSKMGLPDLLEGKISQLVLPDNLVRPAHRSSAMLQSSSVHKQPRLASHSSNRQSRSGASGDAAWLNADEPADVDGEGGEELPQPPPFMMQDQHSQGPSPEPPRLPYCENNVLSGELYRAVAVLSGLWEGRSEPLQKAKPGKGSVTQWKHCMIRFTPDKAEDGMESKDSLHGCILGFGSSLWKQHTIPFNLSGDFTMARKREGRGFECLVNLTKVHCGVKFKNTMQYPNLRLTVEERVILGTYEPNGQLTLNQRQAFEANVRVEGDVLDTYAHTNATYTSSSIRQPEGSPLIPSSPRVSSRKGDVSGSNIGGSQMVIDPFALLAQVQQQMPAYSTGFYNEQLFDKTAATSSLEPLASQPPTEVAYVQQSKSLEQEMQEETQREKGYALFLKGLLANKSVFSPEQKDTLQEYKSVYNVSTGAHTRVLLSLGITETEFERRMGAVETVPVPPIVVETSAEGNSSSECRICFDRPIDCLLQPCRHFAICAECSKQLKVCPICREDITDVQLFFRA